MARNGSEWFRAGSNNCWYPDHGSERFGMVQSRFKQLLVSRPWLGTVRNGSEPVQTIVGIPTMARNGSEWFRAGSNNCWHPDHGSERFGMVQSRFKQLLASRPWLGTVRNG